MTRTRVILLVSFLMVFAAGVALGTLVAATTHLSTRQSYLSRKLDLTPEQRQQVQEIWSGAVNVGRQRPAERRKAIRKEHEEAVRQMLTEDQKVPYEEMLRGYSSKLAALEDEKKQLFQEAVTRTKAILDDRQREEYEAFLKKRNVRHDSHSSAADEPGRRIKDSERDQRAR